MTRAVINLQARHRTKVEEPIGDHYERFVEGMQSFSGPLSMQNLPPPRVPFIEPGSGDLVDLVRFNFPIKGLKLETLSKFRHETCVGTDAAASDDLLNIDFKVSNSDLHYQSILANDFPKVVQAYDAYRAAARYDRYAITYTDGFWNEWAGRPTTNPTYWKLRADPNIDIDGRNNIYTLAPAVFWDGELCRRALGFDRDEAIRRLTGHAILVRPLMDGVYAVLNDDPQLSYEDYVAMNQRFKGLLGLI